MTNNDGLDRDFRAVTRTVRGEPVHWEQVEHRAQQQRPTSWRIFGVLAAILTIAIACTFIAVKLLVDPAYRAEFTSATTAISFGEGATELGHTELGDYMRATGVRPLPTDVIALREEGFVLRASLHLIGLRHRSLSCGWTLRSVSNQSVAATAYASPAILRPPSDDSTATVQAWMSYPQTTGSYRVDFTLRDAHGRVIDVSQSRLFTVVTPRISSPYRAPGYSALLPKGWKLTQRYEPASPGRFVTKLVGSEGLSVLIDTTRHVSGDPASSAITVEDLYHGLTSYRRIAFHRTDKAGRGRAFEWTFEFERLRRADIFFYRGGDGYAVLAVGPPRRYVEIVAVALKVARSILSRPARS